MGRMLMTFIAVLMPILFIHVQKFPKFDDFIKNGTDTSLPVSMIVNACRWFLRLVISKQNLHRFSRLDRQAFMYGFGISHQRRGYIPRSNDTVRIFGRSNTVRLYT